MQLAFFNHQIECISKEKLKELQLFRIREILRNASMSVYYQTLFKKKNINIDQIQTFDEFQNLIPLLSQNDIAKHFPFGFIAVDKDKLVRMHTNVGAYAPKRCVFYTKSDLENWAEVISRTLYMAGIRNTDIVQIIVDYDLYSLGSGIQMGVEFLGAIAVSSGIINPFKQIQLMSDIGTTAIITYPSYTQVLLDYFYEMNLDPRFDIDVHALILTGEPLSDCMREKINNQYGLSVYNCYGNLEIDAFAIASECEFHNGMHVWEDNYYIEIIDPDTLKPITNGDYGELVITHLKREGMPLLRYRTGDITRIISEPCLCGRTHQRIDKIFKRTDNLIYFKGKHFYPSQLDMILRQIPEVSNQHNLIIENINNNDEMIVEIGVIDSLYLDNYAKLEKLNQYISKRFQEELQICPKVRFVQLNHFDTNDAVNKIIDKRKIL